MPTSTILVKIESLRSRSKMLTSLRDMVDLKPHQDIQKEQWDLLQSQLSSVSNKILQQLRIIGDAYLAQRESLSARKMVINRLGELELEITSAYDFYDTFMDILTQRLSNDIGPLLRGCDVIAADAMQRGLIADLTIAPLVYCDRGFGAATLREGVNIMRNVPNPIPFISIPYSRLTEKYNLISINHEVGHQALVKLNMVGVLAQLFRTITAKAGASALLQNFFANWSREIGPDFWAFCLSGMAQTCSLRDVLILPKHQMFQISASQVHPPAYIRFLISTQWCRQLWGQGVWDSWEEEWKQLYNPAEMDEATCQIIEAAQRYIPVIAKACMQTRFKRLGGKTLLSLFSINELKPELLLKHATTEGIQSETFKKLPIGAQLAAFRLWRESRTTKQAAIDHSMSQWLQEIQKK